MESKMQATEEVRSLNKCKVHILPTPEAIELYNKMVLGGETKVSAFFHSTC